MVIVNLENNNNNNTEVVKKEEKLRTYKVGFAYGYEILIKFAGTLAELIYKINNIKNELQFPDSFNEFTIISLDNKNIAFTIEGIIYILEMNEEPV